MLAPGLLEPMAALGLAELRRVVCEAASRFQASELGREGTLEAVSQWSAITNAANAALALAAARLAAFGPPPSAGARDTAELLARQTGTTTARARAAIAHGERLGSSPRTRRAATGGHLSAEQAGAIADAAALNPEAEARLIAEASSASVGELRQSCARAKAERQDLEEAERAIRERRCLRRWRDAEGAEHLHARGTKRDMALIDQALKGLIDERFEAARSSGTREPLEAYGFDALMEMARRSLDIDEGRSAPTGGPGGEPGGGGPAGAPDSSGSAGAPDAGGSAGGPAGPAGRGGGSGPAERARPKRRDPIRYLSVLRLDLSALVRGHIEAGETCEIAGLGPIPVSVARELLGESVLKLVITEGVAVRNVTHLGRGPTVAQKIALLWEQPVCAREGCGRRVRLEYDHREDWARTHHTRLDELEPLCHPDHHLKTVLGWALVAGTGIRPMVPPDDPRHPDNQGRAP